MGLLLLLLWLVRLLLVGFVMGCYCVSGGTLIINIYTLPPRARARDTRERSRDDGDGSLNSPLKDTFKFFGNLGNSAQRKNQKLDNPLRTVEPDEQVNQLSL